jgi:hypothetical protein
VGAHPIVGVRVVDERAFSDFSRADDWQDAESSLIRFLQ